MSISVEYLGYRVAIDIGSHIGIVGHIYGHWWQCETDAHIRMIAFGIEILFAIFVVVVLHIANLIPIHRLAIIFVVGRLPGSL